MIVFAKIIKHIKEFLGILDIEHNISDLKIENERLLSIIKDHEKDLSYIAVIQVRTIRDLSSIASMIEHKNKPLKFTRKPDDDIVN